MSAVLEVPESQQSLAYKLAMLNEGERALVLGDVSYSALLDDWRVWARPAQLPPDWDWMLWLVLAGRGFGKTWVGANWVCEKARYNPGWRIALVGPTAADVRDVMIEGDSGILNMATEADGVEYQPSKRRVVWGNGSMATCFSAEEPKRLRGPQHHAAWGDELAAWKYQETYDQLMFGLRLGDKPQALFTTTPRPIPRVRELMADPACAVTRGGTNENRANLAKTFLDQVEKKYGGTRLGKQELEGAVLDDTPGALWNIGNIDGSRLPQKDAPKDLQIVVSVDPAATSSDDADDTGIIVAGKSIKTGRTYVLEDCTMHEHVGKWAQTLVELYHKHKAECIVAEVNQGGEMVAHAIHNIDESVRVEQVSARESKHERAVSTALRYEQGRVHHLGSFPALEDQMTTWVPGEGNSPDRVDALVWADKYLNNECKTKRAVARVRSLN